MHMAVHLKRFPYLTYFISIMKYVIDFRPYIDGLYLNYYIRKNRRPSYSTNPGYQTCPIIPQVALVFENCDLTAWTTLIIIWMDNSSSIRHWVSCCLAGNKDWMSTIDSACSTSQIHAVWDIEQESSKSTVLVTVVEFYFKMGWRTRSFASRSISSESPMQALRKLPSEHRPSASALPPLASPKV